MEAGPKQTDDLRLKSSDNSIEQHFGMAEIKNRVNRRLAGLQKLRTTKYKHNGQSNRPLFWNIFRDRSLTSSFPRG